MKKISLMIAAIIAVAIVVSCGNQNEVKPVAAAGEISKDSLVRLGEYLVNAIGCDDCHSPKVMGPQGPEVDMSRRFSGHPANLPLGKVSSADSKTYILFNQMLTAYVGPWGVSYAANLTSDETGIGNWTEEQFFKALREGKSKGLSNGRPLLPPMPWINFAKLKDNDIRAIYYYFKSTQPVENRVPAPQPPSQITASK